MTERKRARGTVRAVVQVVGFGLCVGVLIWCLKIVLSEDNREALERLRNASPWQVFLLMALASGSIALNGLIFWATIRPVKRLRLPDLIATNAIATFLSYLPFKVSVIARWTIHNRRDGVPMLAIGTWFLVVIGLMLVTIAPMGLALVRPEGAGGWWWLVVLLGVAVAHTLAMYAARFVRGERGLARLRRLGLPESIAGRESFRHLHDGADMAGDRTTTLVAAAARLADVAGFGLRFWIAAHIVGIDLGVQDALLIGLAYFVMGVVSPFGTAGTREVAAIGAAAAAGVAAAGSQREALLTAILVVSASEAATSFLGAGFGMAWLRADRLLLRRPGPNGAGANGTGPNEPGPDDPPPTDHVPTPPPLIALEEPAETAAPDPTIAREDRPGAAEPDGR